MLWFNGVGDKWIGSTESYAVYPLHRAKIPTKILENEAFSTKNSNSLTM